MYYCVIMAELPSIAYDGGLFRVEHRLPDGRDKPDEFVQRIGAAIVMPIVWEGNRPLMLTIDNERRVGGKAEGELPRGYCEGGFDTPEAPLQTGLRELREETGYGYEPDQEPDTDCFEIPVKPEASVIFPRFLVVARNVTDIGGRVDSPHEEVTLQPTPLTDYINSLLRYEHDDIFPEITVAFAKAAREHGREAVVEWLRSPKADRVDDVPASFSPRWLTPVDSPGADAIQTAGR